MFTGLRQLGIIIAAIALVLLGLIFIPRRRRVFERLLGIDYPLGENSLESSLGLGNLQHASAEGLYEAVTSDDCDLFGGDEKGGISLGDGPPRGRPHQKKPHA